MREIDVKQVKEAVASLCVEANYHLGDDVVCAICRMQETEESPLAKNILSKLIENVEVSRKMEVPICQDTGMAVVFLEVGQEVHFINGNLYDAINEGVAEGYLGGYLRCSVVADPIRRVNTDNNTPAVIHTKIVPGDQVKITVAPKGFGSENMSAIKMCNPSVSTQEIIDFVVETVDKAGSNPCPPVIVGVGIGGTFEKAAYLSKKALLRSVDAPNSDPFYEKMEQDMLEGINRLGIGPQGFGGSTTALGVNIETYPTHIAGLPVAVNLSCHVTRHKTVVL